MANQRIFTIQINGIVESTNAVNALNESLDKLNERIKEVEKRAIKINASSSSDGYGTSSKSSSKGLSEEEKLTRQIAQNEEKRATYSKEIYKDYLASKDLLKETVNDQKQVAASQRLAADTYSNTMQGMKDKLADLKAMINTTDLGDSDQIREMVSEADQLNSKIKQIEESYGQFGRNVGNYKSAFDGIGKLKITIGGVEREFNSAREASRTLKNELVSLEATGQGNTEMAKQLRAEYYKLQSAMDDATKSSKAMDEAMDFMQSFTAMASIGNGLKAFFGFDDNEIQRSIQRLVALQNVLKGVETIRKQMQTSEGIGKLLTPLSQQIDTVNFKMKRLIVSLMGVNSAAKTAAVGVNLLSGAMKILSSLGIMALISGIVYAIQQAVEWTSKWAKGNADLYNSEERVNTQIRNTNDMLQRRLKLNQDRYNSGEISMAEKLANDEKEYAKAIKDSFEQIKKRAAYDSQNETFNKSLNNVGANAWNNFLQNDMGVTTFGGFDTAAKSIEELTNRYNALNEAVQKNEGLVYKDAEGIERAHLSASDAKDELNHIEQFMAGQLIGTMEQFDLQTEEGRKGLINFVQSIMNSDNDLRKSVLLNLSTILSDENGQLVSVLNAMLGNVSSFVDAFNSEAKRLRWDSFATGIINAAENAGKTLAQKQKDEAKAYWDSLTDEEKKNSKYTLEETYAAIDKAEAARNKKITSSNAKATRKAASDAEARIKYINNLQIKLMREGLDKILKQLEEEERAEIVQAKKHGADVDKVKQYYLKKRLEDVRNYHKQMMDSYKRFYSDLTSLQNDNENQEYENAVKRRELERESVMDFETLNPNINYDSYALANNTSFDAIKKQFSNFTDEVIKDSIAFVNAIDEARIATSTYEKYLASLPKDANKWTESEKKLKEALESEAKTLYDNAFTFKNRNGDVTQWIFENRTAASSLKKSFEIRYGEREKYYNDIRELNIITYKKEEELLKEHLDYQKEQEKKALNTSYTDKASQTIYDEVKLISETYEHGTDEFNKALSGLANSIIDVDGEFRYEQGELLDALREGKLSVEDFYNFILQQKEEYEKKKKVIDDKYELTEWEANKDTQKKIKEANNQFYSDSLDEINTFRNSLANLLAKQPIKNNWQIVDIAKTKKNYKQIQEGYEALVSKLKEKRDEIFKTRINGLLTEDEFIALNKQLTAIGISLDTEIDELKEKKNDVVGEFIASLQVYIDGIGQTIQGVMDAVASYEDYKFDKLQEQLDKENEMLENKLDDQEEIIEKHKDNVNDIEDELAESRGDRRQHLIDLLNQEIEAQRAAEAEKQAIKKKQKALEGQQEALDKKRRKAEYKRNLMSILVSNAMSISNAFATQPFLPVGLAMGALATALGAVQYALAAKQKPYAKGGQLEGGLAVGKRHRDGGIPVLGGRASIEGGEFITNRISTAKNIDLLEFVNSKKKKVELSDMVDFYKGNVRSTVSQTRSRFEDGGMLPTMSNNIDIDEQIRDVIMVQSKQPIYVTVKDIEDRMSAVNKVRVLAGMQN